MRQAARWSSRPRQQIGTSPGGTALADIRHAVPPGVLAGGQGAQLIDFSHATYGAVPLLFALVAFVTFVLLARGLKSVLLPLKAVLLNALSVAATYGLLVLVF
jgi:RND superfamily putative drug exporter